ncbi:MAG: tetratricopeptide repeat protein, partial [Candidatus Omnitrophica bacterium]|nr:tetratricopeptide repeat protein [Candidatus Omnitrophota bacterium]
ARSAGARFCYAASWVAAILAMFTKENTITLPLMVLLYEVCFFRTDRGLKLRYLLGFLPALLIIPLTMLLTKAGHAVSTHEMKMALEGATPISPSQYLFTEFRVMVTYIRLLFLPIHQNVDYDYPVFKSFFEGPVVFGFLFLTAVLGTAVRLFSKYRLIAFSVFWFFLTLLPESSIFPIQDVIFEHRLYLPMAGFSMFLAGGLYYLLGRKSIKMMVGILLVIITLNSVLTYQRNKIWRDDITFWSDALSKSPHKARPYNNLGKVYLDQGHAKKALPYFNKAIELNPYDGQAYYNRGLIFNGEGHYDRAEADFDRAIAIDPISWEAYNDRGISYINQGRLDEAMADLNKSIGIHPDARSYYNRGIIFDKKGRLNRAIEDFNKAIVLKADYPQAYLNRGRDYSRRQDFKRAILDFKQAIKLKADYPLAYNNLGLIYQYKGDYSQAILDFGRAIALKRDYAEAYNNRGFANEDKGHYNQAISDYNKAVELDPKDAEAYANRGRVYGRKKNFSRAIEDFNKAIGLAPKFTQAYINRSVAFYFMKDYAQAWRDVHQAEDLGGRLDPQFIAGLEGASGRDH